MIEISQDCTLKLQGILEELEVNSTIASEGTITNMEPLQEVKQILLHLLDTTPAGTQAFQRLTLLVSMLEQGNKDLEQGSVQEGLWYCKSVVTFLLDGTSAGTVPLAPVSL